MDGDQDSKRVALEKALWDQTMDPTYLPLSLLRDITKNFSGGQEIGRGGFGVVYKGELRNGTVAVKKLHDLAACQEENFQSEVDFLVGVRHKNTVRLLGYCSDTQRIQSRIDGRPVWVEVLQRLLCFEHLRNGSLAGYMTDASSGLHWSKRYEIIRGICEGVHYLHQECIIHMDLKPLNILLDDNMMPKITDFGLSRRYSESQSRDITKTIVGSLGYIAPEFFTGKKITLKADIFSLGVIIMEMLMGCKGRPKVEEVLESWRNELGTLESQIPLEQVKVCAEIAILCMDDDPEKRPTSWDIIRKVFDIEEISNWSTRGDQSTSSISQVSYFISKLEDELKSMNLYGRPFLQERVIALKRAGETSNEVAANGGQAIPELQVWQKAHESGVVEGQVTYYNKAGKKMDNYKTAFKALHGEDSDPLSEPLDEMAVMIAGGGQPHGRAAILSAVHKPTLTLPRVRHVTSSSSIPMPPRPRRSTQSDDALRWEEAYEHALAEFQQKMKEYNEAVEAGKEHDRLQTQLLFEAMRTGAQPPAYAHAPPTPPMPMMPTVQEIRAHLYDGTPGSSSQSNSPFGRAAASPHASPPERTPLHLGGPSPGHSAAASPHRSTHGESPDTRRHSPQL